MTWHPPEEIKSRVTAKRTSAEQKSPVENRRIMLVDMDAFFAAIEQRDNPQLRGRPVIVGGTPEGRGVVATCSYEARKFGVSSGMSLAEAVRRCPDAVFLKTNGKKYTHTAIALLELFHHYSPMVEPVSIDEAYLDITGTIRQFGGDEKLARSLKKEIRSKLQLTATVGIAHNRIFAKLASGLEKPDGLTTVTRDDIAKRVYPLPVEKLWGVGEKTAGVLHMLGITTIGDLAVHPVKSLKKYFGINGELLQKSARGETAAEVIPVEERVDEKSIGHEHTFGADVVDTSIMLSMLLKLSQKVGRRMRRKGFGGKTVTVKLRYSNFETHTHRETLPHLLRDDLGIYTSGKRLFRQLYQNNRPVRLLGISVSHLVRFDCTSGLTQQQEELFIEQSAKKEIFPVMDCLRDKFGELIISRCGAIA